MARTCYVARCEPQRSFHFIFPALCALGIFSVCFSPPARADDPPPEIKDFKASGAQRELQVRPYPHAESYTILSATNVQGPYLANTNFSLGAGNGSDYLFRQTNGTGMRGFYLLGVTPMAGDAVFAVNVLNRLTYGPTPDELERMASIGPEAYAAEQLAPWSLADNPELADAGIGTIQALLPEADTIVTTNHAQLRDLRAWHVLRAVAAERQLLEILLQFCENHFVTEYAKSYTYFGRFYNNTVNNALRVPLATQLEYLENRRWRQALLNPQCTFLDLLEISAESPAMIIYLDTIDSRGDGGRLANENYARELCELFCFGVDNGYDQQDIVEISKCWTGWRIEKVAPADALNPFAAAVAGSKSTNEGVWAFNYKSAYHNTSTKTVFAGKQVPARFGPPWAGTPYNVTLANGTGNNGLQDGYQILAHMANQPFTAEYLSVKLCRLLVHDQFPNPTTQTAHPEYAFYDYTRADLSAEARLVHACISAWQTNSPKGQVWKVVETIVNSDLFRSRHGSLQKVKTPLEFTVSAIRALRSSTNGSNLDGTFTADTDGYSISGSSTTVDNATTSPLVRMGSMMLFDREAPDGYPEDGPAWISAGTMAERIRFLQSYCIAQGQSGHTGSSVNDAVNCVCRPVALLQAKLPSTSWRDAPAVAAYFTQILFPGEGAGNLALYRQLAVNFLNTSDNETASAFSSLTPSGTPASTYDTRVRGMVSLLMTLPRFQEQ